MQHVCRIPALASALTVFCRLHYHHILLYAYRHLPNTRRDRYSESAPCMLFLCKYERLNLYTMMPGAKGLSPYELAHKWVKDLRTRPDMSIKVG